MGDEWQGLFRIWHERSHRLSAAMKNTLNDLADLESRIVKLEAYVSARKLERAFESR